MILTTLVVLSEKLPLLSDSESGESMSQDIVKEEDLDFLAESAFADACRPGNPRDTSVEEMKALYKSLL